MKLLFIGNSHLAAFRMGWDVLAPHCPEVSARFYPHWQRFYNLFQEDVTTGRIHMTDKFVRQKFAQLNGGDGSFRPLDFDLCLIVGGTWLWNGVKPGSLSRQMEEAVVWDYLNAMHPMVLLRKIRAVSNIPVLIITNPHKASRDGQMEDTPPSFDCGAAQANALLGPAYDAVLLSQPVETLQSPRLSKLEYAVGERLVNTWLRAPSPPYLQDDLCHMNAAYGTIYLRKILRGFGQIIGDVKIPPAEGALALGDKTAHSGL